MTFGRADMTDGVSKGAADPSGRSHLSSLDRAWLGNSHSLGSYSRGSLSQWAWDFGGVIGVLLLAFSPIFAGLFV